MDLQKISQSFFELLKKNEIELLLDIRLNNKSQLAGFTKGDDLCYFLSEICNCKYQHCLEYAPIKDILDGYKKKSIYIKYQNGSCYKPLDVVQVPIIRATPLKYQPENILIDTKEYWKKIDTILLEDILEIHPPEYHTVLLGNKYSYITEAGIGKVGHSLILVEVTDLTITHPNEKSTKTAFTYYDTQYNDISVTDPDYYYVQNQWHTDNAVLVMSLPESPYNENYYYKFVAKIFSI